MSGLKPEHARVVLAVHACGTTAEAARRIHMTQSAVSKIITRAERLLETQLFERRAGRLRLRDDARELLGSLVAVEAEWERCQVTATRLRTGEGIPLKIITTPSIGHSVLARALRRLKEEYPGANVKLGMGDPIDVLREGAAEIGFMFSPRVGHEIETAPVMRGRMVALIHRDDPLAGLDVVRIDDLAKRPLICFDREQSPLGWLVALAHEQAGRPYAPHYEVPYCLTAAHLAANGCGVALVDDFVLHGQSFEELVQRPLVPEIPIEIRVMWLRNQPLSQLAKALTQIMQRADL